MISGGGGRGGGGRGGGIIGERVLISSNNNHNNNTHDRLCGLVIRVLGYISRSPGSIPGTTRFSQK
jgi:hypothetical protein